MEEDEGKDEEGGLGQEIGTKRKKDSPSCPLAGARFHERVAISGGDVGCGRNPLTPCGLFFKKGSDKMLATVGGWDHLGALGKGGGREEGWGSRDRAAA